MLSLGSARVPGAGLGSSPARADRPKVAGGAARSIGRRWEVTAPWIVAVGLARRQARQAQVARSSMPEAASRRSVGANLLTAVACSEGLVSSAHAEVAPDRAVALGASSAGARSGGQRQLFRVGDGDWPKELARTNPADFPHELADDCDVVILGEHHNSSSDHSMEEEFTREFTKERGRRAGLAPAVGLEMVEQQFQPILDSFGRGEISVKDLYDATEWSTRWVWPFELYAPVFEAAKANGSPLVALNPATEVRRKLPLEGLQALTPEDRGLYLPDALGFAATLRDPNFRSYADLVVMPSYDTHVAGEWLGSRDEKVATPQNFLSARVFRDEAMAYAAWRYLNKDQRRGMLLIVGCDHVRYDYGIPARLKRLGSGLSRWQADRPLLLRSEATAGAKITGRLAPGEVFSAETEGDLLHLQGQRGFLVPEGGNLGASLVEGRKLKVATVLLNPTASEGLADTGAPRWRLPSDTAKGPALADYIWAEA